jgi:flagellar basal-body rod protein FlgF
VVRGFYILGSDMLTQSRVLNTLGNNLANVNTTGFKKANVTQKAFGEMLLDRVDQNRTRVGDTSLMNIVDESDTDYSQGAFDPTGRSLDFAVRGDGFFAVQKGNGVVYTRNGSFNLDDQGYLVLSGQGRVLGDNGPIRLGTDKITVNAAGDIYTDAGRVGRIALYDVADKKSLTSLGEGIYSSNNAVRMQNQNIMWKNTEGSNVDVTTEMTQSIASERQLQSCSSALKMYDEVLDKAVDISKL